MLITDFYFDIKYGLNTCERVNIDNLTIESDNQKRGFNYQATQIILIKKIFNKIKFILPEQSVFVDFGCGKGRVCFIASRYGFSKVIGIEFAHELYEIAKNNLAIYKAKVPGGVEIEIIESDAVNYSINNNDSVFFMFNPFDELILSNILENIVLSLKTQFRKILIIYYNPQYGDFISKHSNFVKLKDCFIFGYKFTIYSNIS